MKKDYLKTRATFIGQLDRETLKRFAYAPGTCMSRCMEMGLFQGRTHNSPDGPTTARGRRRKAKK